MTLGLKRLFGNIKGFKLQTMNVNEGHRLFLFFMIGIVFGTVVINVFSGLCAEEICVYGNYFVDSFSELESSKIDKGNFFFYCFRKYIFQMLIIVLVNCTSKGLLFDCLICLYKGIAISLLVCAMTISFGSGGLVVYLMSVFPHYVLYVPLFIYSIYFGIEIRRRKNKGIVRNVMKRTIITVGLVIGTAFLEVYINFPLLIQMFA